MDKILFTTFLTFLAGFVAAIMSLVNLVNEKERKISEYRKDWVSSLRTCFSDLIAKLSALVVNFEDQNEILSDISRIEKELAEKPENENCQVKLADARKGLELVQIDIGHKRHELYQAWAMARLHFKPNDSGLDKIEQKYNSVASLMGVLIESPNESVPVIREKINNELNELVSTSRYILKAEWETVKKGEPAYQKTKRYSIWCGVVMLFLLITIGTHAFISAIKSATPDLIQSEKIINSSPASQDSDEEQTTKAKLPDVLKNPSIQIELTNTIGADGCPQKVITKRISKISVPAKDLACKSAQENQ